VARPTKQSPELGDARTRLLNAALELIRTRGFAATTVDDLCRHAGVTKGSFFHHFKSKEALGVEAARWWTETTNAIFMVAPYHNHSDPVDRLLAYIEFRKTIISDNLAQFTCLAGTMAQEVYIDWPDIRVACGESILGHAATLEVDIELAIESADVRGDWTAVSLARHIQAVIQGAFVVAKAANNPDLARESLDHLERYVRMLFRRS
jgi:TetR/AcrR family transcriptional regulator, transcriptional repressor for nem operon